MATESETLTGNRENFDGEIHSTKPVWKRGATITITIRRPDYSTWKETFKLTEKRWTHETARSYLQTMLAGAIRNYKLGKPGVNPKGRKRNAGLPYQYVIAARHTKSSPRLYFTGKALDNTDKPRVFTRWKSAVLTARALERRYPHIIGRYYVSIESYQGHAGRKRNPDEWKHFTWLGHEYRTNADASRVEAHDGVKVKTWNRTYSANVRKAALDALKRKQNPSPRDSQIQEAARRFSEFSGHDPETTRTIEVKVPPVMLAIGELDGILYTTVRDHKREAYIHKFKKSARPLLAASHDGRSLSIVGGRFEFTEAGIEDR
jgi:hypothetical protein